jgi:hypothetical protein
MERALLHKNRISKAQTLVSVILAIWEAEIRKIAVPGQPDK